MPRVRKLPRVIALSWVFSYALEFQQAKTTAVEWTVLRQWGRGDKRLP